MLPVLLLMFLFSAIACGGAIVTRVEVGISERFRQAAEALYAADAGLHLAVSQLRALENWTAVVSGNQRSAFVTGAFGGSKPVPGGGVVVLCCGRESAVDRLASDTRGSPLPARRTVVWQPYLWALFDRVAADGPGSRFFLVVWVANDEDEPADAGDSNDTVIVRSEAIAPGGVTRAVEAIVSRRQAIPPEGSEDAEGDVPRPGVIEIVRWRDVR